MRKSRVTGRASALASVGLFAMVGAAAASPQGATITQTSPVRWHAQSGNEGEVPGATATLTRTNAGIGFELHATELMPGTAYTLWLVIINDPSMCSEHPCPAGEFLEMAEMRAQVTYAGGEVAGESGEITFSGTRDVGPIPEGWLADTGLTDPRSAEVQLVVNSHGPELAEFMPAMIETYRAGCTDDSIPPIFPDTARADGEPGPNTCVLTQAAAFAQPPPDTAMERTSGGGALAVLGGMSLLMLAALLLGFRRRPFHLAER